MEIVDNRKKNKTSFGSLVAGSVFIFRNIAYMKIPQVNADRKYNSINLITGYLDNFANSNEVESIKCELILKD